MNEINQQSMLRVGTILRGVYRVEDYLSSGGFGNTYVVRNVEFDEVYALKEFYIKGVCQRDGDSTSISVSNSENAECFTQQREKFKKEARRIRGLHNDHIVKVHDLFEENGTAYYVMDLVDGESLKDRLKRTNKPLTEAEVSQLLPQILDGLKAIHDMHIWHLDIKPANIMVDKQGTVKLIDFGSSKQQSSAGGATTSTGISYTVGYAPPEQMAQEYGEFGPWTDFYALGSTLYKLLTLQNPPSVTKVSEDETADKNEALPMPGVSVKMKRLIVWMMRDRRKRRPQSAEEIISWLAEPTVTSGVETPSAGADDKITPIVDDATTVIVPPKGVGDTPGTENENPTQGVDNETSDNGTDGEDFIESDDDAKRRKLQKILYALVAIVVVGICIWGILSKNGNDQGSGAQEISYKTFTVNGVSFDMARVEAGTFTMGATSEQQNPDSDEKPAHQVTLTNNYYLGKTEVTQALWKAVMGSNPSNFKGDNKPVEQVSWNDCQTFISKLNAATGKNFRLPTEAEWEFAARGGNNSRHYQYSGSNNLLDVAWYIDNSSNTTHDVASKQANELGLYDMSGNVWEWCSDWYGSYSSNHQYDPAGPTSGSSRVLRGGSWHIIARCCRSSYRSGSNPDDGSDDSGLRLALSE